MNQTTRLRRALIPLLVGGQNVGPALFAEIFGAEKGLIEVSGGAARRRLKSCYTGPMEISDPDALMDAAAYLRGMAFHEAGHAVVAWALNLPVGDIHIREIGAGNGGAQISCADDLPIIDRLAVCFAGIEAGTVFQSPQPSWAGNSDHRMAFEILDGTPEDHAVRLLDRGGVRASELLVEHADKVTRLVTRLLEVHAVDAAEFLRMMSG
jgi:hypothetical protein